MSLINFEKGTAAVKTFRTQDQLQAIENDMRRVLNPIASLHRLVLKDTAPDAVVPPFITLAAFLQEIPFV